jgi:hypothetical protein
MITVMPAALPNVTSKATTVSAPVIAGAMTRKRAAGDASIPRPTIHQKISPTIGQLNERQKTDSMPAGTAAGRASPANAQGMFRRAGVASLNSASFRTISSCGGAGAKDLVM